MATANHVERARQDGVLLGIPLGDLGWFQSLLIGLATGFTAFFATTFVAIIAFLVDDMVTHHMPDMALTYRRFGFPAGVVVGVAALAYLGAQYVKRVRRKLAKR
jgi:hypothetical protein